jgi:hypothetical protein
MLKKIIKFFVPYGLVVARQKEFLKETHINRALRHCHGTTYVEIGVDKGICFRKIVAAQKIGVDPKPLPVNYMLGKGESICPTKSDDFFAQHVKEYLNGQSIDVAFVDGHHEFTQALRDVLNLEPYMSRNGFIFMHDCNPPTREHVVETLNGDVWKVASYLSSQRKDLFFFTLDCDWGLGVLTGFHSPSIYKPPSSEDLSTYKQLDYGVLEKDRRKILNLKPSWYSSMFINFLYPRRRK